MPLVVAPVYCRRGALLLYCLYIYYVNEALSRTRRDYNETCVQYIFWLNILAIFRKIKHIY